MQEQASYNRELDFLLFSGKQLFLQEIELAFSLNPYNFQISSHLNGGNAISFTALVPGMESRFDLASFSACKKLKFFPVKFEITDF